MKFARRTDWPRGQNRLAEAAAAAREGGAPVIDLTESNPTRCGFRYLSEKSLAPLSRKENLLYEPDPRGLLEAREAVCRYYAEKNIQVTPDQVFLTAGTSEAYGFLFKLLCDPGDRVLAPRPSYPLLDYLADLADIEFSHYEYIYRGRWQISLESLEKGCQTNPKAFVALNPNNPTGNFLAAEELEALTRLAASRDTVLISDEVFLDFAFREGGAAPISLAGNSVVGAHGCAPLRFTLSGISKILGLPQMKVSWIIVSGPESARRQAAERLEIIADTYLSVNTPSQRSLVSWMENRQTVCREISDRLAANRDYLLKIFKGNKRAVVSRAEGGWYAVLEIGTGDEEMSLFLLQKYRVLVHPGYLFNFPNGNFLVMSLLSPVDVFKEGMRKICHGLYEGSIFGSKL